MLVADGAERKHLTAATFGKCGSAAPLLLGRPWRTSSSHSARPVSRPFPPPDPSDLAARINILTSVSAHEQVCRCFSSTAVLRYYLNFS